MRRRTPSRLCLGAALAAFWMAAPAGIHAAQPGGGPRPPARTMQRNARQAQKQEHLPEWLERHSNMPVPEQLRQLETLPGFHELPPQTQQRYRDEVIRLNNMPPQQRERRLAQNEILDRMSQPQRQQYRSAVQYFASLPPDRRRMMARAVLDLREMPPEQRQAVIDSAQFRGQFSDPERSALSNLLAVEPYPPVRAPAVAPAPSAP